MLSFDFDDDVLDELEESVDFDEFELLLDVDELVSGPLLITTPIVVPDLALLPALGLWRMT